MSISNKTIYITGGSTGIGLSIALALAKSNNTLCLFARDLTRLDEAKAAITEAGAVCHIYSVDAKNYTDVKETMDMAVSDTGAPDILINCVGRAIPHHFEDITGEMMEDTMRSNLGSAWNAIQSLLPSMKEKGGSIINTSSISGFLGIFGYTDYSASKFALVGFSESLRQELKQYNIKVQVLCPPDTDTPGFALENRTKPEETKKISEAAALMSADAVAAYTLKAMEGNAFMIIPGFDGKFTFWMKRLCPSILNILLDNMVAKVQGQYQKAVVYRFKRPAAKPIQNHLAPHTEHH